MRFLFRHIQVFIRSCQDLLSQPLATLANVLTIGIALSLPTIGYGLIKSVESLSFAFENKPHINIYISPQASSIDIDSIIAELNFTDGIASKKVISQAEALTAFEQTTGIRDILKSLPENPLPTTIVINPEDNYLDTRQLLNLKETIEKIDGIDEVQINQVWLERMRTLISFAENIVFIIVILVSTAIVFTLANTVRLMITNRQDEIMVGKLVGATDSFVRRPFLYIGSLYGMLGGITAYLIYLFCFYHLQQPIKELAASYQTTFTLYQLNWQQCCLLIGCSSFLGWLAARFSVATHLQQIKPQ